MMASNDPSISSEDEGVLCRKPEKKRVQDTAADGKPSARREDNASENQKKRPAAASQREPKRKSSPPSSCDPNSLLDLGELPTARILSCLGIEDLSSASQVGLRTAIDQEFVRRDKVIPTWLKSGRSENATDRMVLWAQGQKLALQYENFDYTVTDYCGRPLARNERSSHLYRRREEYDMARLVQPELEALVSSPADLEVQDHLLERMDWFQEGHYRNTNNHFEFFVRIQVDGQVLVEGFLPYRYSRGDASIWLNLRSCPTSLTEAIQNQWVQRTSRVKVTVVDCRGPNAQNNFVLKTEGFVNPAVASATKKRLILADAFVFDDHETQYFFLRSDFLYQPSISKFSDLRIRLYREIQTRI